MAILIISSNSSRCCYCCYFCCCCSINSHYFCCFQPTTPSISIAFFANFNLGIPISGKPSPDTRTAVSKCFPACILNIHPTNTNFKNIYEKCTRNIQLICIGAYIPWFSFGNFDDFVCSYTSQSSPSFPRRCNAQLFRSKKKRQE